MTEAQGYQGLGLGWLAMAAFDTPHDAGTLVYAALALVMFIKAVKS